MRVRKCIINSLLARRQDKEVGMRILILLLAFVLIFSTTAFCHNPTGIFVIVKEAGIDVVVNHFVGEVDDHYIKKIEVILNGKVVAIKEFTSQTDESTQQVSFDMLLAKKGDLLQITAYCNISGYLVRKMTVE
jgi:desulfoferrodoxin (superoxide reductase-like protein)